MLDFLNSLVFGVGSGFLGTLVSVGTDWLRSRQAHKHALELRQFDLEVAREEAASAAHKVAVETEGKVHEAEVRALEQSYRNESTRISRPGDGWLMQMVDVIRGLTRPALTIMFVCLTGAIFFMLTDQDAALKIRIIETVLALTTTCVIWWFGGRRLDKPVQVAR